MHGPANDCQRFLEQANQRSKHKIQRTLTRGESQLESGLRETHGNNPSRLHTPRNRWCMPQRGKNSTSTKRRTSAKRASVMNQIRGKEFQKHRCPRRNAKSNLHLSPTTGQNVDLDNVTNKPTCSCTIFVHGNTKTVWLQQNGPWAIRDKTNHKTGCIDASAGTARNIFLARTEKWTSKTSECNSGDGIRTSTIPRQAITNLRREPFTT